MKKTFRTLSVMALAGLVMLGSCKKNDENNNTNTNAGDGVLRAGIEQPTSNAKTSFNPIDGTDEAEIRWTAGDQILVYGNANNGTFTLIEGAESNDATFRCPQFPVEEQTSFRAAYPAGIATITINNDGGNEVTSVTFNIPAEQTLTTMDNFGNGANPMVAYSTTESMQFKNVFGGVGIKLMGTTAACHVTKLVLTDDNNMLCGQFMVANIDDPENNPNPQAVYAGDPSFEGHTITVNLPEGGVTVDDNTSYNVYVMLPVGALDHGFTLAAYDGNTLIKDPATTTSSAATVAYNTVQDGVVWFEAVLPAGQANTVEGVVALVNDPDYTGTIEIVGGTLDFSTASVGYDEDHKITQKILVAEGANVTISNLYASFTGSGNSAANTPMEIGANATVELDNVHLKATAGSGRGLVVGPGSHVTIQNGSKMEAPASGGRGVQVEGDGAHLEVYNSEITAYHYPINLTSNPRAINATVDLNGTTVKGYCALNIWGYNNVVNATDCTLHGFNNVPSGTTNDFAAIAVYEHNNTVNVMGGKVIAESLGDGHNPQYIFVFQNSDWGSGECHDNRFVATNGAMLIGKNVPNDISTMIYYDTPVGTNHTYDISGAEVHWNDPAYYE